MSWILLLAVVLAVVVILASLAKQKTTPGTLGFPYQLGRPLFSPAERSFLGVLDQAVGTEHRVFGKVRVADVAAVKPGLGNSARQGALNRIAAKHFDYVVCRAEDLSVVCAVELNDKSHATRSAIARDELISEVCHAIGLPIITVPAKATYSPNEVREQFLAAIAAPHR